MPDAVTGGGVDFTGQQYDPETGLHYFFDAAQSEDTVTLNALADSAQPLRFAELIKKDRPTVVDAADPVIMCLGRPCGAPQS